MTIKNYFHFAGALTLLLAYPLATEASELELSESITNDDSAIAATSLASVAVEAVVSQRFTF